MDKETLAPNNDTKISQAEEGAASDTVSARRRRFIRASAAVPVIMTLRSGAAAAAVSMDCRDNDANRALADPPDSVLGDVSGEPAHDEWLRIFANIGKKVSAKVNGTQGLYYIVETNSATEPFDYFDSAGNPVTGNGQINQINNGTQTVCYYVEQNGWECTVDEGVVGGCTPASCTTMLPTGPLTTALTASLETNEYKVVQLLVSASWTADGQTAFLTYYPQMPVANDYIGAPITDSCWCSVSPDFTPQG